MLCEMFPLKRWLTLALVVAILISLAPPGPTRAQEEEDQVMRLMALMSDAAKVGQLFLVTFPGDTVAEDSIVAELIAFRATKLQRIKNWHV